MRDQLHGLHQDTVRLEKRVAALESGEHLERDRLAQLEALVDRIEKLEKRVEKHHSRLGALTRQSSKRTT